MADESESEPVVKYAGQDEPDMRNAALLVDPKRRQFLANLDPSVVNSYAVLYARDQKYLAWAQANARVATKAGKKEEAEVWLQIAERFACCIRWLDSNLEMSGAIRGVRAEQLADVLSGKSDPQGVGGTHVVIPNLYQPTEAPKKRTLWGR